MKLKNLPGNTQIASIKIKLTPELRDIFKDESNSNGEDEIYYLGFFMGENWISPDPPKTKKRKLYFFPPSVSPTDLLECEIIKT